MAKSKKAQKGQQADGEEKSEASWPFNTERSAKLAGVLTLSREEDKEILDEIREENLKAGREEAGRLQRAFTTCMACTVIGWAVITLFDFVTGKGFVAPTVVMFAMAFGAFWGTYRESRDRELGWYAVILIVLICVLAGLHFAGILS